MSANQKLPIVLAHGIARFDILHEMLEEKLGLPDDQIGEQFQYFKGIKSHLESKGFKVFHPNEDFAGGVDLRAEQLRDRVNEVTSSEGVGKVHIIGHSMGGLDARHMIVDKGMADSVASLTTIGTPHLGTSFADYLLNQGGTFLIEELRKVINLEGIEDLSITACEQFNSRAEEQEASNGVFYQTYASSEELKLVFLPIMPSWVYIQEHEGRNDGLVPFKSQQWKKELVAADGSRKPVAQMEFPLPADHLNEVGWWDPHEAMAHILSFTSLLKQAADYESKIRDIYLNIAQNLP